MLRFTLPMLALLGGCAATPEQLARQDAATAKAEARLDRALAGLVPRQPVACINPRGLNSDVYGDKIVYRSTGRQAFLNQTSGGCFGLSRNDILVTRTPTGQICRGDIIQTVDRTTGFQSGSCVFGDFVPYTRAPRG